MEKSVAFCKKNTFLPIKDVENMATSESCSRVILLRKRRKGLILTSHSTG